MVNLKSILVVNLFLGSGLTFSSEPPISRTTSPASGVSKPDSLEYSSATSALPDEDFETEESDLSDGEKKFAKLRITTDLTPEMAEQIGRDLYGICRQSCNPDEIAKICARSEERIATSVEALKALSLAEIIRQQQIKWAMEHPVPAGSETSDSEIGLTPANSPSGKSK